MARRGGDGWLAVALLGFGIAAVGVAVAAAPEAERRRARAREIRQQADRWLLDQLVGVSQDPLMLESARRIAWAGASLFRNLWIESGRSGSVLPSSFKLRLYGNWCGPGYGGGPCIDEIDCLCREHDAQYEHAAQVEAGRA